MEVARSGYGLLVLCYPVDSELEIYPGDSYERFNNCEAWMIPTQVGSMVYFSSLNCRLVGGVLKLIYSKS